MVANPGNPISSRFAARPSKKAVFDQLGASMALIVTSPLILAATAAILLKDGRPVFFCQVRPGYREQPFTLYKLRTMRSGSGPDGDRLTPLGRFLRASSIDELPALWNVVRGDMSLVGPRPLLMDYLDKYTPEQARRHLVKPGITGLAQINGRNALPWRERFALDIWYVDNRSFALDVRILLQTLFAVLTRSGINAPGSATMPPFSGET